jgi:Xaa-Pro aminopeptidase
MIGPLLARAKWSEQNALPEHNNRDEGNMTVQQRVAGLRTLMKKLRVQAYIVPSTDAHLNEYVPLFWRRRAWITGFTGSAGEAVFTLRKAGLWTDGRYFLQAEQQLKGSGIALMKLGLPATPTIPAWLGKELPKGARVGVDPQVFSIGAYDRLRKDLADFGIELVSIEQNLVDALWKDRPSAPTGIVEVHPVKYAGESIQSKLRRLRRALADAKANAHVVAALDSIAWLFNIRGADVEHNPVTIAYAIVTGKDASLFVDLKKIPPVVKRAFGKSVRVRRYEDFRSALRRLARTGGPVWADSSTTNRWVADILGPRTRLLTRESPIVLMKAAKNKAEIRGAQAAHVRDGVAMTKFLCWLDKAVEHEKITEISAADKLEAFRRRSRAFRGLSFDTIMGYAAHGAIIHYSAMPETDVPIKRKGLMVIDSGGQYVDGTTDITRTVCLSAPSAVQRDRFTRVLKGHIQIKLASFPAGTTGPQLDLLARRALWEAGLDYGHGTGHGVGSRLCVHEGPQAISPMRGAGVALVPGMIISNEPGYYKAGEYGIRTENLVVVVPDTSRPKGEKVFLTFANLTLCPIDLRLVNARLLTREEVRYLNAYHQRVRRTLSRFLNKEEAAWLVKATRPIR